MPDTPLNPDALAKSQDSAMDAWINGESFHYATERVIKTYLAFVQPEVTGEQVNLAGWTCNGIHEPGDYSTCEECRDACDDLA